MKLEWMGEYRDVVEALIHYCNIYAAAYKVEKMEYRGVTYSFSQIQVLEYLLENEARQEKMSAIARRLGITRSNFTKIIKRLSDKGLVEKQPVTGSRKEIMVSVNALGRELYNDYAKEILRWHFSPMFDSLGKVPAAYRENFRDALNAAMEGSDYLEKAETCEEQAKDKENG